MMFASPRQQATPNGNDPWSVDNQASGQSQQPAARVATGMLVGLFGAAVSLFAIYLMAPALPPMAVVILCAVVVAAVGGWACWNCLVVQRNQMPEDRSPALRTAILLVATMAGMSVVGIVQVGLQAVRPLPVIPLLLLAGMVSVFVLMIPVFLVVIASVVRSSSGMAEPAFYLPIDDGQLSQEAAAYIDRQSARLEALGFRRLGTYRVRLRTDHFARMFLNDDGTILAEAAHVRLLPLFQRMLCTSLVTLFDDRRCLETGDNGTSGDHGLLEWQQAARRPPEQLLALHEARRSEIEAQHGCRAVALAPGDECVVALYAMHLLYANLESKGQLARNPYSDNADEICAAVDDLIPSRTEEIEEVGTA